MPNGKLLVILLVAQSANGTYAGDQIAVWDKTNESCMEGWGHLSFGAQSSFDACGFHYEVNVTSPPNATVTVKNGAGGSVTLPLALLYRARALKARGPFGNCNGTVYQGGTRVELLHFDCSVFEAALDPNVNAMGLTPTSVTPYKK
jgi:hypothetical protein